MNRIVVDANSAFIRAGLVEDSNLCELIYENRRNKSLVGNIYVGRVMSIQKGIRGAFINIGQEKNGILYLDEVNIKNGESILVQVLKDSIGNKGATLTRNISFTGRYSVLTPFEKGIGVSKKINSKEERERLKGISSLLDIDCGVIIRTGAINTSLEEIALEINSLYKVSKDILNRFEFLSSPSLVYEFPSIVYKMLMDTSFDEVVVNDKAYYEYILKQNKIYGIEEKKVVYYNEAVPIFENYFIEDLSNKAFNKKVWLKSGGFLYIERTEAMHVIDVNSGKFTGKGNFEETAFKTNIEAVIECARQIRLRNLSGIIIIDFIDMREEEHKKELIRAMERELKKDRVKAFVVGLTSLGLMEITRKKTINSNTDIVGRECPCCKGEGIIPSTDLICEKIKREISVIFSSTVFNKVTISANLRLLKALGGEKDIYINEIMEKYNKTIVLKPIETARFGYYEIQREKS